MARFTETVNIQPQNMSSGFSQGASSLVNRLEQFGQVGQGILREGVKNNAKRGATAASQQTLTSSTVDGRELTDAPAQKEATLWEKISTGGAEANSYNKTMQTAYLSSLANDNREAVIAIERENPADIIKFNESVAAYSKGVLAEVDPSVRGATAMQLDDLLTSGRIRVQGKNEEKNLAIADAAIAESIAGAADYARRAARQGDTAAVAEALVEVRAVINSLDIKQKVKDSTIKRIEKETATENVLYTMRNNSAKPGGIATSAATIMEFRDQPVAGFTVDEQEVIYKSLVSDLNGIVSLKNKQEDDEKDSATVIQNRNSEGLYLGIVTGESNANDVVQALANKEINQAQATKLLNGLNNSGQGTDDWALINAIEAEIRNGTMSPENIAETISSNTGSRITNATGAGLIASLNNSQDRESPLQTNVSKRAERFIVDNLRVTGMFGSFDPDEEKNLANARREYSVRVLGGEDPFDVADDLIGTDRFQKAPQPKEGSKTDLDAAEAGLKARAIAGAVDEAGYNREWNNIQLLRQLTANAQEFNKAKKDHLDGR